MCQIEAYLHVINAEQQAQCCLEPKPPDDFVPSEECLITGTITIAKAGRSHKMRGLVVSVTIVPTARPRVGTSGLPEKAAALIFIVV